MSRTHSDGNVHMHIISVMCARHGAHRVIVAGLDDRADWTAEFVLDALKEAGDNPSIESTFTPVEHATLMADLGGIFGDDL